MYSGPFSPVFGGVSLSFSGLTVLYIAVYCNLFLQVVISKE